MSDAKFQLEQTVRVISIGRTGGIISRKYDSHGTHTWMYRLIGSSAWFEEADLTDDIIVEEHPLLGDHPALGHRVEFDGDGGVHCACGGWKVDHRAYDWIVQFGEHIGLARAAFEAQTAVPVMVDPAGGPRWFAFGTFVDYALPLEFYGTLDEAGMPKWERPVTLDAEHMFSLREGVAKVLFDYANGGADQIDAVTRFCDGYAQARVYQATHPQGGSDVD